MRNRFFAAAAFLAFAIATIVIAEWSGRAKAGIVQPAVCNLQFNYDSALLQTLQVIGAAGAGSSPILICGFDSTAAAAQSVQLVYGTGVNCATSPQNLTPAFNLGATTPIKIGSPFWTGLAAPNGQNVCVKTTVATSTQVVIYAAFQ